MIVVSDSTPLISLMKATKLNVLEPLFHQVLIPDAVFAELTSNPNYADEAAQIKNSSFIQVVSVTEQKAVDVLRRSSGLDLGESEAIVYADDHHADVLLMDEAAGRQVAKAMGLYVMGTVGVLLLAREQRLLTAAEAEAALQKLRDSDRHISEEIFQYALKQLRGE